MLITVLVSCKSYYYVYDVEMIHPVQSKALIYQNDTMSVEFGLEPKDISITMTNKTDEGIKINWDDVSFSLFGNANRIVHKETSYLGHTLAQPSTTIPPHTKLKDILIRSKDVHFYSAGNNSFLVIDNLFPDYDFGNNRTATMVAGLKGSQINIFLPFYVGETRISKYYILSIKDILKYKKNPKNFMLGKTPNQIGSLKVKTKK
jgi:hypothetical protein